MTKIRKLRSAAVILLAVLALLAVPSVIYADETDASQVTEEGYPYINLPGKDVIAEGTQETEVTDVKPAASTDTASYSYQASSFPDTSAHPDTVPYLIILALAISAAFIYRHNMILEKRNNSRDEHDAEMEEFRLECEAARQMR